MAVGPEEGCKDKVPESRDTYTVEQIAVVKRESNGVEEFGQVQGMCGGTEAVGRNTRGLHG